jgi:hypothetical protein
MITQRRPKVLQTGEGKLLNLQGVSFVSKAESADTDGKFQNLSPTPGRLVCIQTPAGVEEFFERMSLLAESGPPDVAKMAELAR